ncbi:putative ribonuclease H-like domain-containing protein [Tanacetum coccineum]
MELESTNSGPTAKLPILKLGEYEMWAIRIKQYFQIQDYALWEVIENGDSWVSISQTTEENGITISKMSTPATAEEKTKKKNDVKARGLLLMALPNEHQLTFSHIQIYIFVCCKKSETRIGEQIHKDDLEAIDLKWQLSLLSVRAKKYYQKTGRKIFINGNNIDRYDKSKVECYNCHKLGHFARECRASRSKEDQFRNQDNTRKQGNKEDTSKAMLAIDGVGFDWSDMAEEQYSAVPPPHPLIYNRPNKLDLSYSGLDEFKEPEFKGYGPENSKKESNVVCEKESDNSKENSDKSLVKELEHTPIIENWVQMMRNKMSLSLSLKIKTVIPTAAKIEKPVKKSVRYAEMYRSQRPRGNQRNWNGQKSNQLGSEFVMYNKACFNCGSFKHVQKNCTYHQKKKVVNTVRPRIVNTARSYRTPVNTVRPRVVNTARQNRTSVNAARANGFNAVKPSACWVWRPIKPNSASITLNRYNYTEMARAESNGCSRHMTSNIVYLSDFKKFDGGYVAFGGENPVDKKEKLIRSDNGTEFKNRVMDDFCREKGIKREYSLARTPQQNGVAERSNRTLIEDARTMLADSKLHTTFWAEAVFYCLFMYKIVVNAENVDNGEPKTADDIKSKDEDAIQKNSAIPNYNKIRNYGLPNGKKVIGTKWVFRNKKDERGMSAFLYGTIEEEVYVTQPPGFKDPDHPDKVYKVYVDYIIFGSTNKEYVLLIEAMKAKFQNEDKYVAEILKKFNYSDVKSASTPVDLEKPLVKDGDADDVDVHLYRSMIGSLMYLTTSRPDIMFVVCACARFQVTPKTSHLLAVKRIFRYLKGKPTLGLWYSRDSLFELVAYTDSDYARATQDRKSTTGGC